MQKGTGGNLLLGAALVIIFLAGIFALAHFSSKSRPAIPPAPPSRVVPPKEAAAKVQPSFIGRQKIGDWLLTCRKPREAEIPPGFVLPSSAGAPSKGAQSKNGPRKIVLPRCVMMALLPGVQFRKHPYRIMVQLVGFRRRLAVVVQLPGLQPSDSVALQLSSRSISLPVLACAKAGVLCLVGQIFNDAPDLAALGSTRKLAFVLPPGTTFRSRILNGPVYGFAESFATLRRVEQASAGTAG